ncbi:MAG: NADH-quinone oxidoreductase subunit N [Fimbriimonadales bacterium]|nr:NADH-quinone oxidoreductase subunit N [Fimbriimonadales bacterium]
MPDRFLFPIPQDLDWFALGPIIVVVATGLVALIVEMLRHKRNNAYVVGVSVVGLLVAGAMAASQAGEPAKEILAGTFLRDRFGCVVQVLMVAACLLSVLFSEGYLRQKRIAYGEAYPLMLWATAGGMVMATSRNLVTLFVGLELLSVSLYVLAGLSRTEAKSEESALKYFLLGAFASAFLLYGIALFYGATGSLHLGRVAEVWTSGFETGRSLLAVGMALILIGLSFKSAFVPFHQWTPDVYQGAPTNIAAFMAAGSKVAAVAMLYRVLDAAQPMVALWLPPLFWVAILTMVVGNLAALVQKDAKRLLAYSSISHAGYLLVALLARFKAPDVVSDAALLYYLASYSFMTIGAFAVISVAARAGRESTGLSALNGLWQRSPFAAVALLLFVWSLIGVPGASGFVGKLLIFRDALAADLVPLAIVLAVASVVSVAYYLALVRAAWVADESEADAAVAPLNAGSGLALGICAAGVLGLFVFVGPLLGWMAGPRSAEAERAPIVRQG